ncbi:MAG: hypothetical protein GY854_27850 [Deltaproteobacteria bacterium]|nr:hypothetical protein [Deltaproteobacteria bacterium]
MMKKKISRFIWSLVVVSVVAHTSLGASFYVDPVNGDMSGDGSASNPWRTIQEVVENGLIETQEWESLPYEDGAELVPRNDGAPVKAGDTILLRSGYHGELVIESHYNSDWITVAAEEGHTPELSRVHVRSSANWILRGFTVSPELAADYECDTLIFIESHNWRGPVFDITVEDCTAYSVADSSAWSVEDWNNIVCNGARADGERITLRGNTLKNVDFGISVNAKDSLIERNTVENFSGDGMRGLGDDTVFQYNTVKNSYDVNDNHDDGFQSWSRGEDDNVGTGEVKGIVLRGNLIINYENPDRPHRGSLQGIGCFDGMFVGWIVENNVVVTDHWHGITLSGARDCRIVNNTVIDLNDESPGPPWIRIGSHKNGTQSQDCVVRNNLTTALNLDEGQNIVEDHNLIVEDLDALFVDAASFDLHLVASAAAIDQGSEELAPSADRDGIVRPQGQAVDIGAYEYCAGECETTDAGVDSGADGDVDSDSDTDSDSDSDTDADSDSNTDVDSDTNDAPSSDDGNDGGDGSSSGSCDCSQVGRTDRAGLLRWIMRK